MQTDTTVAAPRMAAQFLPTVRLTADIEAAIQAGTLKLRTGQWVEDTTGSVRGQFIRASRYTTYVSWLHSEEEFNQRTQRFCRAVWHARRKSADPVYAVVSAPRSLSFDVIKDWFRTHFNSKRKVA